VKTQLGVLTERFVDDGIEGDYTPEQGAPDRLRFQFVRAGQQERADKPSGNFSGNRGELSSQAAARAADIGRGEDDARADDADANLAGRWRGSPRE
jgi:hypothetical protein